MHSFLHLNHKQRVPTPEERIKSSLSHGIPSSDAFPFPLYKIKKKSIWFQMGKAVTPGFTLAKTKYEKEAESNWRQDRLACGKGESGAEDKSWGSFREQFPLGYSWLETLTPISDLGDPSPERSGPSRTRMHPTLNNLSQMKHWQCSSTKARRNIFYAPPP